MTATHRCRWEMYTPIRQSLAASPLTPLAQINNEYFFIITYLCPMRLKDEQKIDLVFTSTLTLVGQVGLVGLTMPLIAKQSGVAIGTLYIYFKNKDDLIH